MKEKVRLKRITGKSGRSIIVAYFLNKRYTLPTDNMELEKKELEAEGKLVEVIE
ncbi:MAG: hypothetical protein ACXACF_01615 [Candidatus Hermodarchaeia archaeon]|jgi:hypothetical protein